MKISDIIEKIPTTILTGDQFIDKEVLTGYCSDLLSRVMANGPENGLWITVQTHTNIIAVATLLDLHCIIIPENIEVDENTIEKAKEEDIVILSSPLSAFELSGRLYELGLNKA
ncbi:MAG TPA: AraC family transcriptional regulator [Clostridia bacterium]|nr:AraC family transcriptional regulator [Clostridia bacterium]